MSNGWQCRVQISVLKHIIFACLVGILCRGECPPIARDQG